MSADTNNYKARVEAAQDAYMSASGREPQDTDWGVLVTDEGTFVLQPIFRFAAWFETRDQMLDFIERDLVLSASGAPVEEDADEVLSQLAAVVEQARSGTLDDAEFVAASVGLLAEGQTLDWMGTFQSLCTSDDPVANAFRAGYWVRFAEDDHDENGPQPPIDDVERADFIEYLRTFGV